MAIRIIHIGVGGRGRNWLDYIAQHPEFSAAACVDIDEKVLQGIRRLPGQEHGKFFTSYTDALTETQADAVLITTPSFLHAQEAGI